jgi:RNA polymerase sigma-70 factor, ECF subfamily
MVPLVHIDGLFSYAMTLTRNVSDAEDLVQETYLGAMKATGQLSADNNMKSRLFAILRDIWFDQLRRKRTRPNILELDANDNAAALITDTAKDPHELYASEVTARQVREAIQQLSVECREIILLREHEELSYQEISRVLNCPVGTVMSRLARARWNLRAVLSERLYPSKHRASL